MTHRSCHAGFIIDCQDADPGTAAEFWSAALGETRRRKPQGRYVKLDSRNGLHVEVQKVAHESRVHLDIAANDIAAEVARLERLGARPVRRLKNWTVMEAPAGHRFCVVRGSGRHFEANANTWEDGK